MIERFEGVSGRRLRADALAAQKMVCGNRALAEELADRVQLRALKAGEALIEQDADDNEVYFVLAGTCDVVVNGRKVGKRGPGDHLGEMAAIQPAQKRSASVRAAEDLVVAFLPEPDFADLASRHPEMYRTIAQELARRLMQRNALVGAYRDRIRVFIISSAEAMPIAREIQEAFAHDAFLPILWTDGVFRATHYTLQDLEAQVDSCDFAIAIAHADDLTESRGKEWPSARDNVIFELGLFMGRLGRHRAILMEPREEKVKLPSDLAGVTTIPYRYEKGRDAAALLAPACNALRKHINELGPNNG
jgi:CRP/FNR family transcriptional regulator, cyclic AMP receptor protein